MIIPILSVKKPQNFPQTRESWRLADIAEEVLVELTTSWISCGPSSWLCEIFFFVFGDFQSGIRLMDLYTKNLLARGVCFILFPAPSSRRGFWVLRSTASICIQSTYFAERTPRSYLKPDNTPEKHTNWISEHQFTRKRTSTATYLLKHSQI